MAAYYISILLFSICSFIIGRLIIDPHADSLLMLTVYGIVIAIPLFALYILFLFHFTKGMKSFVARKPVVYQLLNKITYHPLKK
jgi:hypothetical protein